MKTNVISQILKKHKNKSTITDVATPQAKPTFCGDFLSVPSAVQAAGTK